MEKPKGLGWTGGVTLLAIALAFCLGAALSHTGPLRTSSIFTGVSSMVTREAALQIPPNPSEKSFLRLQADPSLVDREPALLAEFAAAPWLLPPRCAALPYAGEHNLVRLLSMQAANIGGHEKVVTLIAFSRSMAEMLQNNVYTMTKFGQVRNLVVMAPTQEDLEACAEMNLPCADMSSYVPLPLSDASGAENFGGVNFAGVVWARHFVLVHALQQGYTVIVSDIDVAFASKPLVESLLALADAMGADGVMQEEEPIFRVNTGLLLARPTSENINLFQLHVGTLVAALNTSSKLPFEQGVFSRRAGRDYFVCDSLLACDTLRRKIDDTTPRKPLFRTFLPSHAGSSRSSCAVTFGLGRGARFFPQVDPTDSTALFVHPICTKGLANKTATLDSLGFWYMDSDSLRRCPPRPGSNNSLPFCRPRQWRVSSAEAKQYARQQRPWLGISHAALPAYAQ